MKAKTVLSALFVASSAYTLSLSAQTTKSQSVQIHPTYLQGKILDPEGKPLALATVALLGQEGQILDGAIVGEDGTFKLSKGLEQGKSLRVQMQGYTMQTIKLTPGQKHIGDIRLERSTQQLQEVEIKGEKRSAFKMQGTSLNASIASTSLGNLPSVINILSALPFVSASQQSVEVQGRGTPIIYYGHQRISHEELLRLNPKDVKDIEVILVPDATYPAGTPAVIKIKPKSVLSKRIGVYAQQTFIKNKDWGYRSMAQGYYDKSQLSLKLGFNAMSNPEYTQQELGMRLTDEAQPTTNELNSTQNIRNRPLALWADAVYRPNNKHELGAKLMLVRLLGLDIDVKMTSILNYGSGLQKHYTSTLVKEQVKPMNFYTLNTYYQGKLAPKWTLHAEANYYERRQNFRQIMDIRFTKPTTTQDREESLSALDGSNWSWRTYLDHSIKGGKLQLGHDGTWSQVQQNYQQLEVSKQYLLPNTTSEQQQSNFGLFASWQQAWSANFSSQVGLRLEHQASENKAAGKMVNKEDRLYLFPSLTLSYNKGKASTSLTYENIVNYPSYERLSNDILYINELALQSGNPLLKPSIQNKLSLNAGYNGLTLTASLSRINNAHHIQVLKRYDKDPQRVLFRHENFDLTTYRVELAYAKQIGPWRPTWSASMYKQDLVYAGRRLDEPLFNLWWKNFLMLPAGFMLQANAQLFLGGNDDRSYVRHRWGIDLNLMKRFGQAWSLALDVNDLFTSRHNHMTSYASIGETTTYNRKVYPYLTLSATYNFQARQDRYRGGQAGQAERSRF